uniref:Uncharacterized protein n=1 Tax=Picea sitchensis TaxID=3332 RepID=B8LRS0_PICSI|nr:unknown [Picea sitchensis]
MELKLRSKGFFMRSLNVRFDFFWRFFLFNFSQNLVRKCWVCRFEWLSLYNQSGPGVSQH